MTTVKVNGNPVEVNGNYTVLQVCDSVGVTVPRFCYHDFLSIAGNCRMCLVQINGAPKLQTACSTNIAEGMEIVTNSPAVIKAQKDVMAMILINHPLDCPICDQGGECDLQDQAFAYGSDKGMFTEDKRAVPDKDFGPLVYGYMTRCINCTRCIRFLDEIAGNNQLGGIGRNSTVEISTYIASNINSELSGNLVDVCPVGALVNKPYRGKVRPWELNSFPSIDIMDALGSHINVDVRGDAKPMRIRPIRNDDINEVWISDKARYTVDALMRQRIDTPWIRKGERLVKASWSEAYSEIKNSLPSSTKNAVAAIAGDLADVEGMLALKDLMKELGSNNLDTSIKYSTYSENRASYLFNSTVNGIEEADACLIIGANPRLESPVLNSRIRKRYLKDNFPIALIGEKLDLSYKYNYLGASAEILTDILNETNEFSAVLKNAKKPMIILGQGALNRPDSLAIIDLCEKIAAKFNVIQPEFNGFNILQDVASRVGALDIGFKPSEGSKDVNQILTAVETNDIKTVFLLGVDDLNFKKLKNAFVVYIGHHGDNGASIADVVLPARLWLEKSSTYVNLEGRVQQTLPALTPINNTKDDWQIFVDLAKHLGKPLKYNSLDEIRKAMVEANPVFANTDVIQTSEYKNFGVAGSLNNEPIKSVPKDYYLDNAIARSSATMAECKEAFEMQLKKVV